MNLKSVSKVLFMLGIIVGLGAVGYTFYLSHTAPPGFCPINPSRPFMGVAVVLLAGSLAIDGYLGWKKKHA